MLHIIAMGAVVVAAIGQRQVQAVWGGGTGAERHDRFQVQVVDRAGAIRADEFLELARGSFPGPSGPAATPT